MSGISLFPGIMAPVLAEVLYDRGGPAVPLLVLGPCMIVGAIAAGESRRPAAALNGVHPTTRPTGMEVVVIVWRREGYSGVLKSEVGVV